ncbi:retron Ec67 family RNA-directed DNA polymerase/endonuclease [Variovorax gossypii]
MTAKPNKLEQLRAAKTRAGLAHLLEIEHSHLTYLLYGKSGAAKYKEFDIPKRSGGVRTIAAPEEELKSLQRRLGRVLQEASLDIEKLTGRRSSASHGFQPNKSILTNAQAHRNKRYVLNIDLQDFFPSITAKRIRGFFVKEKNFELASEVATAIAHISCYEDCLPQGAPSSPVISNLIAGILDFHLIKLAKEAGCRYTRYVDDITFSTNKKDFPHSVATLSGDGHSWTLSKPLRGLIKKAGFDVNDQKTRMQYRTSRQQVTGLVVNKKVNVPAEYRKLVRAYVFSLINHGKYQIKSITKSAGEKPIPTSVYGTHAQLHGMLGFIHSVDNVFRSDVRANPQNHPRFFGKDNASDKKLEIYRRFLLYTNFFSNSAPMIVCEGKTDNVYITNAAHQSKKLFPQLIHKSAEQIDVLSFLLMKYDRKHKNKNSFHLPNFSTVSILGAGSGGVDNLKNMIIAYKSELPKFRASPGHHPVIFIVDNDVAGKKVFSVAKENSHPKLTHVTGDEPFVRVFANLYLVPIPKGKKPETSIEDLFHEKDIPTSIDGKKLVFSNDNDSSLAGKADFAFKYVDQNADSIDWTGFHPLLKNICAAIDHHKSFA